MEKTIFRTLLLALLLSSSLIFSQGNSNFNGQVLYHTNYGLSGVTAYLKTTNGTLLQTAVTDNQGYYTFPNVTPGNYLISFSTTQAMGGVDLSDTYLVWLKLVFNYYLNPIQTLAADVNGSGSVTWSDYFMILISYLNQGNPFPQPWVFQTISTPIPVPARTGFTTGGGSSSGDVNGSLVPDPKSNSIFLESPFVNLTASSTTPVEFDLTSLQDLDLAGMHLSLTIPEGLDIVKVEPAINGAHVFMNGNKLNITWMDSTMQGVRLQEGSPLISIKAIATNPHRDINTYSLKMKEESHLMNTRGEVVNGLKLNLPVLNVSFVDDINCTAYPNPFTGSATIEFNLPSDGQVTVTLFDQAGKQVMEIDNGFQSAGKNQVKFDGTRLLPGVYHYSVRMNNLNQAYTTGTIIKSK